jgi:hypothetical protein
MLYVNQHEYLERSKEQTVVGSSVRRLTASSFDAVVQYSELYRNMTGNPDKMPGTLLGAGT